MVSMILSDTIDSLFVTLGNHSTLTKPSVQVAATNGHNGTKRKASSSGSDSGDQESSKPITPAADQNGQHKVRCPSDISVIVSTALFQRKTSPFRRIRDEDADPEYLKKMGKNAFENKVSGGGQLASNVLCRLARV